MDPHKIYKETLNLLENSDDSGVIVEALYNLTHAYHDLSVWPELTQYEARYDAALDTCVALQQADVHAIATAKVGDEIDFSDLIALRKLEEPSESFERTVVVMLRHLA